MGCRPQSPPGVALPPFRRLFLLLLRGSPFKFYLLFMRCFSTSLSAIIRESLNLPSTDSTSKAGHCMSASPHLSAHHSCQKAYLFGRSRFKHLPSPGIVHVLSSQSRLCPTQHFSTHDKQSKVSVSVLLSQHFRPLPPDLQ